MYVTGTVFPNCNPILSLLACLVDGCIRMHFSFRSPSLRSVFSTSPPFLFENSSITIANLHFGGEQRHKPLETRALHAHVLALELAKLSKKRGETLRRAELLNRFPLLRQKKRTSRKLSSEAAKGAKRNSWNNKGSKSKTALHTSFFASKSMYAVTATPPSNAGGEPKGESHR